MDLALNNLQRLICHKTQQTKPNQTWYLIELILILCVNEWGMYFYWTNRRHTYRWVAVVSWLNYLILALDKYGFITDVFLGIFSHRRANVGRLRTYLHMRSADTSCSQEDLPGVIDDRDKRREKVSEIRVASQIHDDDICKWFVNE